jgi:oligopeptide transport system ATP-binding protein
MGENIDRSIRSFDMKLLDVKDLRVEFKTRTAMWWRSTTSTSLSAGETLGIVGESGSGKSQTACHHGAAGQNGVITGSAKFQGTRS